MIVKTNIAVIIPYFGKFPECFPAWRVSALNNPDIDFIFFTDNKQIKEKNNIVVEYMSFSDFVNAIQSNYDFKIECSQPYKICDFRPAFGEIFKEKLAKYDFWGYCDVDLVFGDIKHFITEDILRFHDRIMIEGHISLFRNNEQMNTLYRSQGKYPEYNYQEAFTTPDSCYFDEYRGMELKLIREKIKVFIDRSFYINADPRKPYFNGKNGKRVVALWEDGKLFQVDGNGVRYELMYIHICKRKMELKNDIIDASTNRMVVVPGYIFSTDNTNIEEFLQYKSGGKLYKYWWTINRLMAQFKRYSIFKIIKLNIRRKQVEQLKSKMLMAV